MKHGFGAGALAIALTMSLVGTAFAHAHLVSADPAPDSTIAETPSRLVLTFSEPLELAFTGVSLTGPNDDAVQLGEGSFEQGEDKVLVVPVVGPLRPGAYTLDWHVLSTDGHKTSGRFDFTVKTK